MKRPLKYLLYGVALWAVAACSLKEAPGTLVVPHQTCYIPAEEGQQWIPLDANTEWRLEYPSTSWVRTDIRGGKATTKGFYAIFDDNPNQSIRFADIRVFTLDKNAGTTLRIVQYPRLGTISFERDRMTVRDGTAIYTIPFTSTIRNENLTVRADGVDGTTADWLSISPLGEEDTRLSVTIYKLPSYIEEGLREANLIIDYHDEYGRLAADTLLIRQINSKPENAKAITFEQAKELMGSGEAVEDNLYVEGYITADGSSDNYCGTIYEPNIKGFRYIIENDAHEPLLFESASLLNFNRFAKVRLWLLDLEPVSYEEGSFSYRVFSGLDESHVIQRSTGAFTPLELTPGQLTPSMVFRFVKIKDVEISMAHGAFTNFKETSPVSAATSSTHTIYFDFPVGKVNWKKSYPEYFRFFPTLLRGKDGHTCSMYISPNVSYAHESYPQGGGSVSGIVVREIYTNFDIDETAVGIRPLKRSDIELAASRADGITQTLVDFEFNIIKTFPGSVVDASSYVAGTARILPNIQQTTSSTPCTFLREGATAVARWYSGATTIGAQDKFRGDAGLSYTDGNNYRAFGIATQVPATQRGIFYVQDLCTSGITTQMSLQIEVNANRSTPTNPIRARVWYSLDNQATWQSVDNSEIKFLCQFDRDGATEKDYREPTHIPGMKLYDINLPSAIANQPKVFLKIEQGAGVAGNKVVRFGNLSIKYNKQ